jgi:long-chain acyl-CoA synthetase
MEKIWLKFYDEGVPETLELPTQPLGQYLADSAARYPDVPATIFGARVGSRLMDAQLTYRQLDELVDRFAAGLQQMGIQKGDRVAIMLPNCPQFVIAAYALWRIGGVVVCCNPLYVAREIDHLLNDSGAETMIVMSSLYERVKGIRDGTPLQRVIVTNIKEYFPGTLKFLFTLTKEKKEGHRVDISGDAGTYWFQDILRKAPQRPTPVDVGLDDISTLIYSGGTTGTPKGAQHTHSTQAFNSVVLNQWARSKQGQDVMLVVMPFFHIYGLAVVLNTTVAGALTGVLIPNPRDMDHVLMSIEKHRVTYYLGVPAMFNGFNNYPNREKYDVSSLRFATSAAAPLPPEVQQRFEEITGGKMVEAYGLTESIAVCMDPIDNPRPHSIGVPLPNFDIRIVDADSGDQEMALGEAGEIIIKGPTVMKGYWRMPTETANALRTGPDGEPGWLFTGDIGYMDEDGYVHIIDRKKDMIIAGGFNVYPTEVEAILFEHPKIQDASVVGVPDEHRGETVKAYVVLKEGETATGEEIIAFCREQMASYKIPRIVEFREDLPKSLVGKVLRRELREEEIRQAQQRNA